MSRPGPVRSHLIAACDRLGVDADRAYSEFHRCWSRLVDGHGQKVRAEAERLAAVAPVPFVALPDYRWHREPVYHKVAALAYYCEAVNAGRLEFFPFGRDGVARWAGITRLPTAGLVIRRLYEMGVITLRLGPDGNPYWNKPAGMAREARYVGPAPLETWP